MEINKGEIEQDKGIALYEEEMRERTSEAVLLSRQACFDAHDWKSLNADSAIIARRLERAVSKS